jgi:hypothetical protein
VDVDMNTFQVGDRVRLISVPEWLVHDLPEDERREMLSFVGKIASITEIDRFGYYWVGFGEVTESADAAFYAGHSFGVPGDCIQRV